MSGKQFYNQTVGRISHNAEALCISVLWKVKTENHVCICVCERDRDNKPGMALFSS